MSERCLDMSPVHTRTPYYTGHSWCMHAPGDMQYGAPTVSALVMTFVNMNGIRHA